MLVLQHKQQVTKWHHSVVEYLALQQQQGARLNLRKAVQYLVYHIKYHKHFIQQYHKVVE